MTPSHSPSESSPVIQELRDLLNRNSDKRVIVVGTTCTGKSTMLRTFPSARDQNNEVFGRMTREESDYVCQTPWTPAIGEKMTALVRRYVASAIGRPLFGTVIIDCDLIIELTISDELLSFRTQRRGVAFQDAKNLSNQIQRLVIESGIPNLKVPVG